ncbi:hypothetical protein D3C79_963230 [compost metagenome]
MGYLGSSWCEQDVHPQIKALITDSSVQTPSQRIEQAAELAEALSKKDQDV